VSITQEMESFTLGGVVLGFLAIIGAALLLTPLVWASRRAWRVTLDLEPVSADWLADKRRLRNDIVEY